MHLMGFDIQAGHSPTLRLAVAFCQKIPQGAYHITQILPKHAESLQLLVVGFDPESTLCMKMPAPD